MKTIEIDDDFYYEVFDINGRTIYSPNPNLKCLQKSILNIIKRYYPLVLNIEKCATEHINQKWLLKMDIKHFYESISIEKIYEVLDKISKKTSLYTIEEFKKATIVNDILPTGAPTSAHIANACMKNIDKKIENKCKELNIVYSRYMDDLFFSGSEKSQLKNIELFVESILFQNHMELNRSKIKYISQNKKQVIMGILVNKQKICLPKETKRKIKAILHQYMVGKTLDESYVAGYLSYVLNVDKEYFKILNKYYWQYKNKYTVDRSRIKIIGKLFNYNMRKI